MFGEHGRDIVAKEMKQFDNLGVVKQHDVKMLTEDQRKNALPCLIVLI